MAPPTPPKTKPPSADKLVEALVKKVSDLIQKKDYSGARQALQQAIDGEAGLGKAVDVQLLLAIVDLQDPGTQTKAVRDAVQQVLKQLFPAAKAAEWQVTTTNTPLVTRELPAGLEALAARAYYPGQAEDVVAAIEWLGVAHAKRFPIQEMERPLSPLFVRRMALRVVEPKPPSEQDWKQIQQWQQLAKGPAAAEGQRASDELLAEGWRAECMIVLNHDASSARDELLAEYDKLIAAHPAYGRYVWCRALRSLPEPAWDTIVAELHKLLPELAPPHGVFKVQNRAEAVAALIGEAAQKRRERARPWSSPERIPFNPFSDAQEAEQYARLLSAGRGLAAQGGDRGLKASLALASFHAPKPEFPLVWSLVRELLPAEDAGLAPDRLPLLYAGVSSFWQQGEAAKLPAQDPQLPAAVGATTQLLLALGGEQEPTLRKEGAEAMYQAVLKPLLENEAFQPEALAPKGVDRPFLSALCGSIARLLCNQKDAPWPLPKSAPNWFEVVEKRAGQAIELYPKEKPDPKTLAGYYALRASARSYRPDYDVQEILSDTDQALAYEKTSHRAYGVRAWAMFQRSRQQTTREKMLEDLAASIQAGEAAEKNCPKDHKALYTYLKNLYQAHFRRANYETDLKAKAEQFAKAEKCLERLFALPVERSGDSDLALGNMYEDFASQLGRNPKENYVKAIGHFKQVLRGDPLSAAALCGLGRCYYKGLVETRLSPKDLGFASTQEAFAEARKCLEAALKYAIDTAHQVDAHWYLAKVYREEKAWDKSEKSFEQAAKLAEQHHVTGRGVYVRDWAWLYLARAIALRQVNRDDPEIKRQAERAEKTSALLKGIPTSGSVVPAREIPVIQGKARQLQGRYEEALKAYDEALPADLAQADALDLALLEARADCNLGLGDDRFGEGDAKKQTAAAEAALRDVTRALELVSTPAAKAQFHYRAAHAHYLLAAAGNVVKHLEPLVEHSREAVRGAPQGADAVAIRFRCAFWVGVTAASAVTEGEDAKQAGVYLEEAKKWQQELDAMRLDEGLRKEVINLGKRIDQWILRVGGQGAAPPAQ